MRAFPLHGMITKEDEQRLEAERILRKAWVDYEPLTADEQRFRLNDFKRSLLWRVVQTIGDDCLIKKADEFYVGCLERDPSLPPLSEQGARNLRFSVERAVIEYFKKHEPS